MTTALVTGGSGFIGSHLCEELLRRKYKVICLDNLYSGSNDNIKGLVKHKSFNFVKGDVRDNPLVNKLTNKSDIIFHLAAIVGVDEVVRNPIENISVNVDGTMAVTKAAFKLKKRIVFTSSSEVYGKNTVVPLKEDSSESVFGVTAVNRWSYGLAKAIGEHILFGYAEEGLKMSIVRYFNSYGPRGTNPRYSNVIPKFIKQAVDGEDLTIYGRGDQSRCFCFVTDTVRGTILAGESSKSLSQVINIGSNKENKITDLAQKIISLTHSKSKIKHIKEEEIYNKKFESSPRRVPSLIKANKLLGYRPQITLEKGLERTI